MDSACFQPSGPRRRNYGVLARKVQFDRAHMLSKVIQGDRSARGVIIQLMRGKVRDHKIMHRHQADTRSSSFLEAATCFSHTFGSMRKLVLLKDLRLIMQRV
jgi:hypothetical protein